MLRKMILGLPVFLVLAGALPSQEGIKDGWIELFNGKDDAEIDNLNNRPLDRNATEPGPILLQGLFAGVAYRNVRIKPLEAR